MSYDGFVRENTSVGPCCQSARHRARHRGSAFDLFALDISEHRIFSASCERTDKKCDLDRALASRWLAFRQRHPRMQRKDERNRYESHGSGDADTLARSRTISPGGTDPNERKTAAHTCLHLRGPTADPHATLRSPAQQWPLPQRCLATGTYACSSTSYSPYRLASLAFQRVVVCRVDSKTVQIATRAGTCARPNPPNPPLSKGGEGGFHPAGPRSVNSVGVNSECLVDTTARRSSGSRVRCERRPSWST